MKIIQKGIKKKQIKICIVKSFYWNSIFQLLSINCIILETKKKTLTSKIDLNISNMMKEKKLVKNRIVSD